MNKLGTFTSAQWGTVHVFRAAYCDDDGPLAIALELDNGEPLAILIINMYQPQGPTDSRDLPNDCFYAKTWAENAPLAEEAIASGLFRTRPDFPHAISGFVSAPVWQIMAGGAE